jgi:hypothetical protein
LTRSAGRRDELKGAGASVRIDFIGVSMTFPDRPRHGSTAKESGLGHAARGDAKARGARRREIDWVHHSSKGGAQVFGVHAGVAARGQNGD